MKTLVILILSVFALPAQETGARAEGIWLEMPELHIRVNANESAILTSGNLSYLQLHIPAPSARVNYGSIHARINTEAANPIMTVSGTSEGMLCNLDFKKRSGFALTPGRNSVEIEYRDIYQRIHYAAYLLIVPEPGSKVPPPVKVVPVHSTGTVYAVIVGISKYQYNGRGINNLQYAQADAQSFLKFIMSPAGGSVRKENIRALFDEEATEHNLRTALFTFLSTPQENDTVLLFFAGHGDKDPNNPGNTYLLTYDTDPSNMGGTAFPMFDFPQVFTRNIKAKRVITFADTCHSFGISGQRAVDDSDREGERKKTREINLINQYLIEYIAKEERAVITSSDIDEESLEDAQWGGGHGVFTYFLLKGLQGAADTNGDHNVTFAELAAYLRQQVPKATANKQHPKIIKGAAERVPLSGPMVQARR